MDKMNAVVGQVPQKFSRKRLPRIPLLITALLVGAVGAYFIIHSLAATDSGTLLWSGDFENGNLSQWQLNQSCSGPSPPAGVTLVTSPVSSGKYAAAFTVSDNSTNANCSGVPTSDPRAQLVGPKMFTEGSDDYINFSTYFPTDFPTTTNWFQFAEIYGPPFGGSPSMGFDVVGNRMAMSRDPTHNYDTIWTSPNDITKGTGWEDLVAHVKFSTDPTVGFVELWLNGVPQKFSNGSTRIYYDTLVPGVNWDGSSPNELYLNQYRAASTKLGTVTLYHDDARVGTSYASVTNGGTTPAPPPSDTTPPTVSLTAPTKGATVSGQVPLSANASDDVGVSKVEFYADGNLVSTDTSSPYTATWDATNAVAGAHTITAKAYDAASNVTTSSSVAVTVQPPPAGPASDLLFNGAKASDYNLIQAAPGAVTTVPDPLGSGENVFKMVVKNTDVAPITPTNNPRAEMLSPTIINNGDEVWLKTKFLLPSDFPSNVPGWMDMTSIYGPPFNSSSPWQIDVDGSYIEWVRNGTYGYDIPWSMPMVKNQWVTILLHEKFSSSGYVELWINGQPITFFSSSSPNYYNPNKVSPTTHLNMQTMDASNNGGPNYAKIMEYREVNMFDSITTYSGPLILGKTQAAVDAADVADGGGTSPSLPPPDTTAPTVSFASPANNSTVSGIVTATANASDNVGVSKVELSLDGNLKVTDTAAPYNYSFDSKTLSNGSHMLTAKAYDAAGNSSISTVTVNVNNPDVTPPNAPTNVKATAVNATTVNLSWTAATDTDTGANPTGVVKYNVLRNGVVIAQPTGTTYTDTTAVAKTAYNYTIQAVDGADNISANSNTATVTTPAAPDTTPPSTPTNLAANAVSANQVNVTWSASTDSGGSGLAGYNIYRNGTKLNSTPVTSTSYGDSTVSANTKYSYQVEAVDGAGNKSAQTAAISVTTPAAPDTTPPSTPTNLTATAASSSQANLTWNASTDSGGSGLAGYNIYRNNIKLNGGPVTGTSYNDAAVSASTAYNYQISAVDGAGNESAKTSSVSVTTPSASGSGGGHTGGHHHHGGRSSAAATAAVAITVTDPASGPVVGAAVTVDGQTSPTDFSGVAHFSDVATGKQNVSIHYNGKTLSRSVRVKSASAHSPTTQSFKVSTVQNKLNPALLLVPVVALAAVAVFIFRPWSDRFAAARPQAQDETPPVVSSNHPSVDAEHPGRKPEKPGAVYSPDPDKEKTSKN